MKFKISKESGTGSVKKSLRLNAPKVALFVTLKCDGETEQIKTLAETALNKCRESLMLSGLNPSALKYCYAFSKAGARTRDYVEFSLEVGNVKEGEDGYDVCRIDERQGTKIPCRGEFGEKQNVVVVVAFCDGDTLVSGFASAAQAQAYGVFENAGVEIESMRTQYSLTPNGEDSEVMLSVHQGVITED